MLLMFLYIFPYIYIYVFICASHGNENYRVDFTVSSSSKLLRTLCVLCFLCRIMSQILRSTECYYCIFRRREKKHVRLMLNFTPFHNARSLLGIKLNFRALHRLCGYCGWKNFMGRQRWLLIYLILASERRLYILFCSDRSLMHL